MSTISKKFPTTITPKAIAPAMTPAVVSTATTAPLVTPQASVALPKHRWSRQEALLIPTKAAHAPRLPSLFELVPSRFAHNQHSQVANRRLARPHMAQRAAALARFFDPEASPEVPYDSMLYMQDATNYAFFMPKKVDLLGSFDRANPRDVRSVVIGNGALEASMAILATNPASMPFIAQAGSQRAQIGLYLQSSAIANHLWRLTCEVDYKVLGVDETHLHELVLWPLLLQKAMLKLQETAVQCLLWDRNLLAKAPACLLGLSGKAVQTASTYNPSLGPAVVEITNTASTPSKRKSRVDVQSSLGDLAWQLFWPQKNVHAMLLKGFHYALLATNRRNQPSHVLLHNPLGYNIDSQRLLAQKKSLQEPFGRSFCTHEQLATLPRTGASFWLPVEALESLGVRFYQQNL